MNTLEEMIRVHLKNAMYENDAVTKDTLRIVIGEIPRLNLKANQSATDDQLISIIEKLIKSETELLNHKGEDVSESEYINILSAYIPEKVSDKEVLTWINDNVNFNELKNKMQAVGMVTKHFGKSVDGKTVSKLIQSL